MNRSQVRPTLPLLVLCMLVALIGHTCVLVWWNSGEGTDSVSNPPTDSCFEIDPGAPTADPNPESSQLDEGPAAHNSDVDDSSLWRTVNSTIPMATDTVTPTSEVLRSSVPDPFGGEGPTIIGKIGRIKGIPGEEVDIVVSLKSERPISGVRVQLGVEEESMMVGRVSAHQGRLTELGKGGSEGLRSYQVDFGAPYRSDRFEPLLQIRMTLSRRIPSGTVVRIPLSGSVAIGVEGEEMPVEGEAGVLFVTASLSNPFPTLTPTPSPVAFEPASVDLTPASEAVAAAPTPLEIESEDSADSFEPTPLPPPVDTSPRIVTVVDASVHSGEVASIFLLVNDARDLTGVQIDLLYDPTRLDYAGSISGEMFLDFMHLSNAHQGRVHLAMTGPRIRQSGLGEAVVCEIRFRARRGLPTGDEIEMRIRSASLVAGSQRVGVLVRNGWVRIVDGTAGPMHKSRLALGSRKSADESSMTPVTPSPPPLSETPKRERAKTIPQTVLRPIHRCDFDFNGRVDANDLVWLIEQIQTED